MALFKTPAELVPFLPVNESFPFEKIEPFLKSVEKTMIKRILGAQYTSLEAAYQADTMTAAEEALLLEVRVPVANLAFYEGADVLAMTIGSLGITVSEDGNTKQASNTQVFRVKQSVLKLGYEGLETMLDFLEENAGDYPDWTGDAAYTERRSLFVLSAKEFSENFNRRISRWVYWNLIPVMKRVQEELFLELLGSTLYNDIITQQQTDAVDVNNAALLSYMRPAMCYATFVKGIEQLVVNIDNNGVTIFSQENLRNLSESRKNADEMRISILKRDASTEVKKYTDRLRTFLIDNLDTYVDYKNEVYDEDGTVDFENDDENGFYYA